MLNLGIVIFDLDGTLVDSMEIYSAAFSQVAQNSCGLSLEESNNIFFDTAGLPLDRQFNLVIEQSNQRENVDTYELVRSFWELVEGSTVSPVENAQKVIQTLAKAGYHLVVSSSSTPKMVIKRLTEAGIVSYFDLILGTNYPSKSMAKGAAHFRRIRQAFSLSAAEFQTQAVFVGDGPHDARIARRAGIPYIHKISHLEVKKTRSFRPDYVIQDLTELIRIFSGINNHRPTFLPISSLTGTKSP